ncbi:MAG: hypothetical protein AB7N24_06860 [Dehalococcoidia bacterium]
MSQTIQPSVRPRAGFVLLAVLAVLAAVLFGAGRIGAHEARAQGTASVTIVKEGLVGEDVASFTDDFSENGTFVLSAAENSTTFSEVEAGTYHVTELPLEGYVLTGTGCSLTTSRAVPNLAPVEGNTLGITVAEGQNLTCTFVNASTQTIQYNVNVSKVVDDALPIEGSFDFTSTWTAANLNDGVETSGDFTLNTDNSYRAVSAAMDEGSDYAVVENGIDGVCDPGDEYRLAGYSLGATPEEATAADLVDTAAITDLQSNWYIVAHNETCAPTGTSSITIVKEGLTGEAEAVFTHDVPGQDSDTFTLTAAENSITLSELPAGTYNFTELPMTGWHLVSSGCSFAPAPLAPQEEQPEGDVLTVILGEDEDQVCTFVNEQDTNTVTVDKYVDGEPAADGTFELTETASDTSEAVVFDPTNGYEHVSAPLPFGTSYALTEDNVDGTCDESDTYRLAGYSVGATLEEALAAAPSDSVAIDSLESDTVVVVWNQTCADLASITIVKDFQPDADAEASFTVDGFGLEDFSIAEGTENGRTFDNLNSGAYSFTEDALEGWHIQSIFCSGQSSPSNVLINLGGAAATISVNAGDHITCTFTNVADEGTPEPGTGQITIIKSWDADNGPDATFATSSNLGADGDGFVLADDGLGGDSMTFETLAADTYIFTEDAIDGWTLTGINCTGIAPESIDVDLTARSLGVNLGEDEDVICTFSNSMDETEPVENTDAVSPITFNLPLENIPEFPSMDSNSAPSANVPDQGTPGTNEPSANVPNSTDNGPANNASANTPSDNTPGNADANSNTASQTNSVTDSPNANASDSLGSNTAGSTNNSATGADAAATPAAPSTGNTASRTDSNATLWIAGLIAIVAGLGTTTAFALNRKR